MMVGEPDLGGVPTLHTPGSLNAMWLPPLRRQPRPICGPLVLSKVSFANPVIIESDNEEAARGAMNMGNSAVVWTDSTGREISLWRPCLSPNI